MRRIVCKRVGALDDLEIEDAPPPEPGPGQVLVDVRACGVNYVDGLFVRGGYQIKPPVPFTPGSEVAGVVSAIGDGVASVAIGDRVIASCGLGGYAERVVAGAGSTFALPDAVTFEQGAAFVQSYATAGFALTVRAVLAAGDWVLVTGAGGGVGRACVDLARHLGARVIAVASSEAKRAAARNAGAEVALDAADDVKTAAREASGGGVDIVVDPVGGDLAEPCLRAMKEFGRYLVIGFVAGIPRLPANHVLLNNRAVVGVDWGAWAMRHPEDNRSLVDGMLALAGSGDLHPSVPATAPLADAAEVLGDLEERRIAGKVVLVP